RFSDGPGPGETLESGATDHRAAELREAGHHPATGVFMPANRLERETLAFAAAAHGAQGQRRKYTSGPYNVHPMAVAALVRTVPHTDTMMAAALLHDVVEDTRITLPEIRQRFGDEVARLVDWLTDVSRPQDGSRRVRKLMDLEHLAQAPGAAQTIKYADLIDNTRRISVNDRSFWPVFRAAMCALLDALDCGDASLRRRARAAAAAGDVAAVTRTRTRGKP